MHTLFDFITQVKTVEYLIAVSAIGLFILFWEVLKPRPFKSMVDAGKEDIEHIKNTGGYRNALRNVGKIAFAPLIGLAYIVALPFTFVFALGVAVLSGASRAMGISTSFGWRPQEAYLTGKKEEKESSEETKED
jgi:hypothetical protein